MRQLESIAVTVYTLSYSCLIVQFFCLAIHNSYLYLYLNLQLYLYTHIYLFLIYIYILYKKIHLALYLNMQAFHAISPKMLHHPPLIFNHFILTVSMSSPTNCNYYLQSTKKYKAHIFPKWIKNTKCFHGPSLRPYDHGV